MKATTRDVNGIAIIKVDGKITIGAGDQQLRDVIANANSNKILLDLSGVTTIDSSGIGELVGSYTTVTNKGGKLKLLHLPAKLNELLHVTQLITVFEVYENEQEDLGSFWAGARAAERSERHCWLSLGQPTPPAWPSSLHQPPGRRVRLGACVSS